jgi:hypothetical protein
LRKGVHPIDTEAQRREVKSEKRREQEERRLFFLLSFTLCLLCVSVSLW